MIYLRMQLQRAWLMALFGVSALILGAGSPFLSAQEQKAQVREDTVVTSDHLEMISGEEENHFHFSGNVEVKGNNLYAKSDKMVVIANRQGGSEGAAIGEIGAIQKIVLEGNVQIQQGDREARAGEAIIFPVTGEVHLKENPVVIDSEGTVRGNEIMISKKERRAKILGGGNQRPTVTLPGFQDMSYQGDDKSESGN